MSNIKLKLPDQTIEIPEKLLNKEFKKLKKQFDKLQNEYDELFVDNMRTRAKLNTYEPIMEALRLLKTHVD